MDHAARDERNGVAAGDEDRTEAADDVHAKLHDADEYASTVMAEDH